MDPGLRNGGLNMVHLYFNLKTSNRRYKDYKKRESVHPVAVSRLKTADKKKQIMYMYREILNMNETNIKMSKKFHYEFMFSIY